MISDAALSHSPLPAATHPLPSSAAGHRFAMLDGWRATSILFVLLGHLVPLGPRAWGANVTIATTGMVLFFILSGFLITRFLSEGADLRVFAIRRFARIVPLAWVVMLVLLVVDGAGPATWAANLLFYANLPPQRLLDGGGHLWSLCVEMQFYLGIALFVAVLGRRALVALPLLALAVTAARVAYGREIDVVTWFRVDEILAGGILALVYAGWYGPRPQRALAWLSPYWLFPLLVLAGHYAFPPLNYARPYIAALTIGATLFAPAPALARVFETRAMAYIATVSYAVYILHGALADTWLGSGDRLARYAKRPLLFGATFALAHLSTFRFERPFTDYAKRVTRRWHARLPT